MKKNVKAIIKLFFSNVLVLITGIATSLILPKILSVEGYGNYKLFTLYLGYFGLLGLGFLDGIYLKFSGKDFDDLDKKRFRLYFKYYLFIQFSVFILLLLLSFFINEEYKNIVLMLSFYLIPFMIISYLQQISQITKRFDELSIRKTINSILIAIGTGLLAFAYFVIKLEVDYMWYILIQILVSLILCLWYVYTYKELIFGDSYKIYNEKQDLIKLHILGFPLLLSNFLINIISLVDRQLVSILFDRMTYSIYAFAYNITTLIATVISVFSLVFYPLIKQNTNDKNFKLFNTFVSAIIVLFSLALSSIFPISSFIKWFLPNYTQSIEVIFIILPGLMYSSIISIVIYNYYKLVNKVKNFFIISLFVLVLSIILNYVIFTIFKTYQSISITSVITTVLWFLLTSKYLSKEIIIKTRKNIILSFLIMILYYSIHSLAFNIYGFTLYILSILLINYVFLKKDIKTFLLIIYNRKR